MIQNIPDLSTKAVALGRLLKTGDREFKAFMNTYDSLFIESDSPENTLADFEQGLPLRGYSQGSSPELEQYYKIIHLLCTLGSVEKMYMPPALDPALSVRENQILVEKQLVEDIEVGPGDTVLDLGCGCGAIADSVTNISGATIYGINLEESQIEKAWKNPNRARLHFSVGDFNKPLPFGDKMFDAVYNIQALTYQSDMDFTFSEVFRVLKPGGRFFSNDVAALDAYDRQNDQHRLLIQHTRELTAFGGFWHYRYWESALERAGFSLTASEGRSAVEMIRKENALFERFNEIAAFLARIHLVPQKIDALLVRMNKNCQSYIEAEERELLSLNWRLAARKS